ncbi:type I-E CRISPR-associated protein Cas6/Cse3/CasE [Methanoculleus bourgensis]|uniref:type I-E CRISPR-associated protein Cas6/Cse3/CasE n=1 Tax=Methanoculleus bourgensis TaxID=83986 RepID=UPI0022EDD646|nr:type I-E CRISPR-associated protein Cas6/Cse3/CasE [Methanoculleus bourgensis]GLI45715.1 type I-E CRISPR-associated protein Cas6/Cse3/CasE [Methanoculleus bourgensis]
MPFFYRIRLKDGASRSLRFWDAIRNPYEVHAMIWRIFSDGSRKKRDFIYRMEVQDRSPLIYAVSESEPVDLDGIWEIDQREYNPVLRAGQRLGFSLRANPVRTKRNEMGKHCRHDVVMDAKKLLLDSGCSPDARPPEAVLVQQEGYNWLESRAGRLGFSVERDLVRADGYRQHRFRKWDGSQGVAISTIDFNGVLTVTDPDRFEETLVTGVGPAKSFGCGLLLVRPL